MDSIVFFGGGFFRLGGLENKIRLIDKGIESLWEEMGFMVYFVCRVMLYRDFVLSYRLLG